MAAVGTYKPRIDEVVVKRYLRGDGGNDDRKYYLSLLNIKNFSISEILRLDFFSDDAQVYGYNCHDWFCFENCRGNYIVYNIKTKQLQFLPPPNFSSYESIIENGTGIGYDSISDDYKVVRTFTIHLPNEDVVQQTELYSIRNNSLKVIPNPKLFLVCPLGGGIYVGGSFYWVASTNYGLRVLRFDFAKETFSTIPLPPDRYKKEPLHYVVDCDGLLGIITFPMVGSYDFFKRPRDPKSSSGSQVSSESSKKRKKRSFGLWVRRDASWTKLYDVDLHHSIRKPLCLTDGRVSLFQGRVRGDYCDLMVYDWITKEMKRLDIVDYPGHMHVFGNLDSGVQLPGDLNGPFLRPCVRQNSSPVQDEAKPIDMIGEETSTKRRSRRKAYKEDVSDGGLEE